MGSLGPWKENTVVVGDCLDVMRQMPDGCVDLVVTDPPYGVRKELWDAQGSRPDFIEAWFGEAARLSSRALVFWLANNLPLLLAVKPWQFKRQLIWHKPPGSQLGGASNDGLFYSYEPINYFVQNEYRRPHQPAWGFDVITARTICKGWASPYGLDRDWGHPTQKPIAVLQWLLRAYSEEEELIFDPFLGSGTTVVAAEKLGRRFFGCDNNPDFVAIAQKRLRKAKQASQLELPL